MKVNNLRQIAVAILFVLSSQLTWAQNGPLTVKPMHPVNNPLVDSIVLSLVGAGVIVENIRCNMVETSKSIGTFKAPGPWLGIQAGMMMVTGQADTMAGPNTGGGIISVQMPYTDTVDGCSGGRQMLNQVLASQSTVVRRATDCVTIQFDIIPATDSIKFNYVFASEEYNTFVCSNFNDIFGFFIKGPGIPGDLSLGPNFPNTKNIALIPGTDLPVSINTVNNGIPGSGTGDNCTFTPQGIAAYVDNTTATLNPPIFQRLRFNGLTHVLQAGVKVIPCATYTLTFTVSDVTDRSYDSGVFIEKGSLRSSGVTAVQSSVFSSRFPYAIVNCNPGKFIFERCAANTIDPLTAKYLLKGTAVNGVDYKWEKPNGDLVDFPESFTLESGKWIDSLILVGIDNPTWDNVASKTVVVKFLNSAIPFLPNGQPNLRGDSTTMVLRKKFIYNAGPNIKLCQGSDTLLKPISPTVVSDRYRWVQLNENNDTIPATSLSCTDCATPIASTDTNTTYIVFVRDSISGCVSFDTIRVEVFKIPTLALSSNKPGNGVCKGDEIRLFANPTGLDSSWVYKWETPLFANNVGVDPDSLNQRQLLIISHNVPQFYKVIATNLLGCQKEDSIEARIITRPIFSIPETDTVCYKTPYRIVPSFFQDTLQTQFSWTSSDRNVNLQDSLTPFLTITPTVSGRYILTGRNNCNIGGLAARDTFDIVVVDSISAKHSYELLQDNFTVAPVQFSSSFYPLSYPHIWKLSLEDNTFDTVLLGNSPLVNIRNGGNYASTAIVFQQLGSLYCADTVVQKFVIDPLGRVYIPNLVLENGVLSNNTFIVTARDEKGQKLREITDGKLTIYNRWGKKIYEKENYNNDLNSKKLKDEFSDGIYFFEFSVERYNYKNGGWLNIQH